MSTDKKVRPTLRYLSISISLLADIGNIYKEFLRPQMGTEGLYFVQERISQLEKHNSKK